MKDVTTQVQDAILQLEAAIVDLEFVSYDMPTNIRAALERVRTLSSRQYREVCEQREERWTHATHHSIGSGCYQRRSHGGAQ